ncbi:MAG: hypothetical protein GY856_35650, partial [bacterium]|nr:hypothetical protein [bacterium]
MSRPAYRLRPPVDGRTVFEPVPRPDVVPASTASESDADLFDDASDELEDDPYYYGWREQWETSPDGSEKLRRIPLTYQDLLDPQE